MQVENIGVFHTSIESGKVIMNEIMFRVVKTSASAIINQTIYSAFLLYALI